MSREWKNRSCCSARLSIFKRLKISIFRHQPRKRWGEATRRDGRSKQRRDVPGGSGAAAPGTGTARDTTGRGCGHREMRDCRARCQGMLSPKRGCSASRWDDQPKGRRSTPRGMPGPKVGCSAPGDMLSSRGGCSALRQDGLSSPASRPWCPHECVGWDAWLLHMDLAAGVGWSTHCEGKDVQKPSPKSHHLQFCSFAPFSSLPRLKSR